METDPNILCVNIVWIIVQTLNDHGFKFSTDVGGVIPEDEEDCWDVVHHEDHDSQYVARIDCEHSKTHGEMIEIFTRKFGVGLDRRDDCHNWIHEGGLVVMVTRESTSGFDVIVDYKKTVSPRTF